MSQFVGRDRKWCTRTRYVARRVVTRHELLSAFSKRLLQPVHVATRTRWRLALAEQHIVQPRVYYTIYAVLLVLTALTTGIAFVDLAFFSPVVALTIAVIKASIVVLFFMHLKYSTRLTWVVAGAGVFWLGILFALSLSDYLTRTWGRL